MVKSLTTEEQRRLHHRYKQDALYRQWAPILSMLHRDHDELDATLMWFLAERQMTRLREEKTFREQEIAPLYDALMTDCSVLEMKGAAAARRQNFHVRRSAATLMCIMLTLLMNAVEKGHEDEHFANEPMCMAILDILNQDPYARQLMRLFFDRKTGYDGKEVVVPSFDPMAEDASVAHMDEIARKETEETVKRVLTLTAGLKAYFNQGDKNDWEKWQSVWEEICKDSELFTLLKNKNPRTSDWDVNEKMVCNVLGMFIEIGEYKNFVTTANSALAPEKNRRDYLSNHGSNGGSSAVLTSSLHQRVENLIRRKHTE